MSASVAKNEVTAAKRRALVVALGPDGYSPLWRGASLTGRAFVGLAGATLAAATGSFTNVRKAFAFDDDTFTSTHGSDLFTAADHGLETGDGPVRVSSSGTLPAGLAAATDYYVIKLTDDTFRLASSLADAYLGTAVAISDDGTGTHTIADTSDTARGIDGEFVYEFPQAETNVDASELLIIIDDKKRAFTGAAATDLLTLTNHELRTGMAVMVSEGGGTLPTGLAPSTIYYAIRVDANTFKLAASFADALAGTNIDLTADSSGVVYLEPAVFRTRTSVGMSNGVADIWAYVMENGHTAGDLIRGIARSLLAKFSKSGNDYTFRDLADTKDSHSGTVTSSGRTSATITDLT